MTLKLLTAPIPAIRAPGRGTEEPVRSGHLALWGCHHNDIGFRCRSTISEAVVAALKRDPHGQYLTDIQKTRT